MTDPVETLKSKLKLKVNDSLILSTEPKESEVVSARQTLNPKVDVPYS